jgi:hypothetical protein
VIAAIAAPAAVVAAGLAGVGAAGYLLATGTEAGRDATRRLGEQLGTLRGIAMDAMAGVRDALVAGDLELAIEVLWLGLQAAWVEGQRAVEGVWLDFWAAMQSVALEGMRGIQIVFSRLADGVLAIYDGVIAAIEQKLHQVIGLFNRAYDVDQAISMSDQRRAADRQRRESASQRHRDRLGERLAGELELVEKNRTADLAKLNAELDRKADAARRRLDDAIDEAAKARRDAGVTGGRGNDRIDGEGNNPLDLDGFLGDLMNRMNAGVASATQTRDRAIGGFDPDVVARSFGRGLGLDAQASEAKRQTDELKKQTTALNPMRQNVDAIRRRVEDLAGAATNGLAFG